MQAHEIVPWLGLLSVFVVPIMGYLVRQQVQQDKRINQCELQEARHGERLENLKETADRIEKKVDRLLDSFPPGRTPLQSVHEA